MTFSTLPPRAIVFKARRETIALVLCATAVTFALSNAVHSHRAERSSLPNQDWTGALADLAAEPIVSKDAEMLTSTSLVVPKSELALPPMPVRALVRLRGCEGSACVSRSVPMPPPRRLAAISEQEVGTPSPSSRSPDAAPLRVRAPASSKPSLMSRLNPLSYVPGITVIKRPFASAGETVTGWFKRF